ncbi:amidohydrolase family protein [Methanosphaerula subterraneus]|uniref:amidohydrolase family protein n=1 Tax=Methanosphaerula subterraneus TaxID=3350244 RepID=UPI003F82CED7
MDEIGGRDRTCLITGTCIEGRPVDILIDETGTIAMIDERISGPERSGAEVILDGTGTLAMHTLANTHTHAAMSLLRGYADDMILQDWLGQKIWPLEACLTGEDVYWGTRLACIEMIRSGTTAFNDMYFFMEEAARAVDQAGVKAQLCYGFIDLNDTDKREHEIKATEALVTSIKGMQNPRIKPAVGPHAVYTVSPEGLAWLAAYSASEQIGIHVHLSETEQEVTDAQKNSEKRPPAILDQAGCLTDRTIAAHCCWLDQADCRLLAERGTTVSHNPASNMKLAVNRAMPYPWLVEAGVPVTLGTDGCASNNNLDLFEEMKIAALLQKFAQNNPTCLPAEETLAMATVAGTRALGFGSGLIAVGEPADIMLIDRMVPCNTPLHHQTSNMVYACNGGAVKTVLCNGRVLMQDRVIPGEAEVLSRASQAAADLVKRAADRAE